MCLLFIQAAIQSLHWLALIIVVISGLLNDTTMQNQQDLFCYTTVFTPRLT